MTKRSQVNTRIVLIAMVAFGILAIFNDYFKIILLILTVGIILLSIISKPSVGRSNSGSISDTRTSNSNQNLNPLFDTKFTNSITNDGDSPMDTFSLDDIPNGRASLISAEYEDWVNLPNEYISVDIETTGLSPTSDRIIEIAAIRFINGKPRDRFSELLKSVSHIPEEAFQINHISDQELQLKGIAEKIAMRRFINFIGDKTTKGQTCLVAHNARFDMNFIINTLNRLWPEQEVILKYIDTLELSRVYIKTELENYRLETVSKYFNVHNSQSHRAISDAETCGLILSNLIESTELAIYAKSAIERNVQLKLKKTPNQEELEIAAIIAKVLYITGCDIEYLRFEKQMDGAILVNWYYRVFYVRTFKKKNPYLFIESRHFTNIDIPPNLVVQANYKGKDGYIVQIDNLMDIFNYAADIAKWYDTAVSEHIEYNGIDYAKQQIIENDLYDMHFKITENEIDPLIESYKERIKNNKLAEKILHQQKLRKASEQNENKLKRQREKEMMKIQAKKKAQENIEKRYRPIAKYDDFGNLLQKYRTVSEASRMNNISTKCIRSAAKGQQKHAAGYVWKYVDTIEHE